MNFNVRLAMKKRVLRRIIQETQCGFIGELVTLERCAACALSLLFPNKRRPTNRDDNDDDDPKKMSREKTSGRLKKVCLLACGISLSQSLFYILYILYFSNENNVHAPGGKRM